MPVLYGVFLYMGVASLSGIQVCCVPPGDVVFNTKFNYLKLPSQQTSMRADAILLSTHTLQRQQNQTEKLIPSEAPGARETANDVKWKIEEIRPVAECVNCTCGWLDCMYQFVFLMPRCLNV